QSDGRCLLIGDVGTNGMIKTPVRILLVEEPDPKSAVTPVMATFILTYPGQAPDVEAMVLTDDDGLLLFSKWRDGAPSNLVYRVLPPSGPIPHTPVAPAISLAPEPYAMIAGRDEAGHDVGPLTDAAIAANGTIYLRDYRRIYRLVPRQPVGGELPVWTLSPRPTRPMLQSEAMAIDPDGASITYTSEGWLPPLARLPLDN
nr:hypothetical protein [Hyphomonadaceae bacterium]